MNVSEHLRCLFASTALAVAGGLSLVGTGGPSVAVPVVQDRPVSAPADVPSLVSARGTAGLPAQPSLRPAPAEPKGLQRLLARQRDAGLDCSVVAETIPVCVHGHDAGPSPTTAAAEGPRGSTPRSGSIGCYGDGTSGPRVRAVYARPEGSTDRYASSVTSIRQWAAGVSRQVDESAKRTGGRRHVRFATTAGSSCTVSVLNVVLPRSAFSSFRATVEALAARGLSAESSKYLVWADTSVICGTASMYANDGPGADNPNNGSFPSYARVDRPCWGYSEAHELVHMLGGVQTSAPNGTGGNHCSDGHDVLCYDDGTKGSTQRTVCAAGSVPLLDCRSDDYFSTAPARGSYLATHWNVARSAYLAPTLTAAAAPRPSSSPAPAPRTTTSPAPKATASPTPPASAQPTPSPTVSSSSDTIASVLDGLPGIPSLPVRPQVLAPSVLGDR